jgi:NTP pyrophosphatase (non-canonical NTP hydrolase)
LEHVLSFPPYSRLLTESARRKIETIYRVDFEAYRESFGSEPSLLASSSSRTNGAIQPQQGFPMSKKAEISPERQRQRRLIYFKQRVPLLRDEMKRLMEETQEIAKKIKHAGESPSPTMKSARERLIYLTEHKSTLQKELTAVLEEQQTLLTGDKKAS